MELSQLHPEYVRGMGYATLVQLWSAAALKGRLEDCGDFMFSWLRWPYAPEPIPTEEMWDSDEGLLFVIDVVASPSKSGTRVGRDLANALLERGIASEGETCHFYRYHSDRYGHAVVRKS